MKSKLFFPILLLFAVINAVNCGKSFLDVPPYGNFKEEDILDRRAIKTILTGAYGMLDGIGYGNNWRGTPNNWVFGSVASDDAYKGSDAGDQPDINAIERYEAISGNSYFYDKWIPIYEGIARCNEVLRKVPLVDNLLDAEKKQMIAEARFLRGHYHFEAKKMWNNVPYVHDTSTNAFPTNTKDIWPDIEADFNFSYENLGETNSELGRANKWAAACYLAKSLLYQQKYAAAKALFDVILINGKTTGGIPYDLQPIYYNNFRPEFENTGESVFAVQNSIDPTNGNNGDRGNELNYPYGSGPGGCCGFYQPSQNLVNAYKTNVVTGLPLLDDFNSTDITNDQGITSTDPFTPYAGNLDPRLDWTVGRRGIRYWDWGPHPGRNWIRDQNFGGPYSPKKHVFSKSDIGKFTSTSNNRFTAKNYDIIRFDDVLLMAAECEVETGSLERARELVNRIRTRAANPAGFVKNPDGTNAANYLVKAYTSPFPDQETARKSVRFERRLELAMEGHRFFDLVRWGIAEVVLNEFLKQEENKRIYLKGTKFTKNRNEYYPIPDRIIVLSTVNGVPQIKQNQGY